MENFRVGKDNFFSVRKKIGSPLITQGQKQQVWIYLGQKIEALAFFEPQVVYREILLVNFDSRNLVQSTERYSLANSRVIDLNTQVALSEGRKLTFLQQLFGNLGNFTAEQFLDP